MAELFPLGSTERMTHSSTKRLAVGLGVALILSFIYIICSHITEVYASKDVRGLQRWRDMALRSEVPEAAEILDWVSRDRPSGSSAPLEQIRSIQWTNAQRDIIAYLRIKTGEDLGADPQPWIQKYADKR